MHKCQFLCHKEVVTAAQSSPYALNRAGCALKTVNFLCYRNSTPIFIHWSTCALNGYFTLFSFVNSCTSYPENSDSHGCAVLPNITIFHYEI